MQYSNPDLDAMIDAARQATDDAERKTMYNEIRQIVQEDAPLIFVHYETINYLMTNDVVGASVNPTLGLRLENLGFTGWTMAAPVARIALKVRNRFTRQVWAHARFVSTLTWISRSLPSANVEFGSSCRPRRRHDRGAGRHDQRLALVVPFDRGDGEVGELAAQLDGRLRHCRQRRVVARGASPSSPNPINATSPGTAAPASSSARSTPRRRRRRRAMTASNGVLGEQLLLAAYPLASV